MIATIIIVLIIIAITYGSKNKEEKKEREAAFLQRLKHDYEQAILSGDKLKALETGRNYYRYKRNGGLTLYDEQAIANDLSTMK
jgi:hypothetical protein